MTDEKLERLLKKALTTEINDDEIKIDENLEVGRTNEMNKKSKRGMLRIAAAMLLILLFGSASVYAARNYFGLLDFTKNSYETIPKEAEGLINSEIGGGVEYVKSNDLFDCKVREALCDSETIMVVLEVSAKEKGKYLFVPTDAIPQDNMGEWSTKNGIKAGDYAKKNGLTLVSVGGGILNSEELGIAVESLSFKSVSDDVMCVYISCGKEKDAKELNVKCGATAMIVENEKVIAEERMEMKFTLEDISNAQKSTYSATLKGEDNQKLENVTRAKVIQTELRTYVDVYFDYQGDWQNAPNFKIKDAKGNVIESIGGSGIESEGDNLTYKRLIVNKSALENGFTIETAFDNNGKEVKGETFLMKAE